MPIPKGIQMRPPERHKLVPIPERRPYVASRTPQISANPELASICGVQQADDESSLQVINHLPGLFQQAKGNPSKGTPHFYANPGKALKCGLPNAANQCRSRKGTQMRPPERRKLVPIPGRHPFANIKVRHGGTARIRAEFGHIAKQARDLVSGLRLFGGRYKI